MVLASTIYRFGSYEFHPRTRELYKFGRRLKLRPQPAQVLDLLLARAGDAVTREELRQLLWPAETFVDFEQGLNTAMKELRAALSDSASQPSYIETLPKLGYRLLVPVELEKSSESEQTAPPKDVIPQKETVETVSSPASLARPSLQAPLRGPAIFVIAVLLAIAAIGLLWWSRIGARAQAQNQRVMVAVLPFENLTGDSAQDYFSDGLTEETISQLGLVDRQRVGVVARTSIMYYKNSHEQLDRIARQLGVQYVLEGSVRRESGKVRISAQLIRVKDQTHLWAREYDRDLSGLLSLQSEIARDVARETERAVENGPAPAVQEWKSGSSTNSYEAYDLYLKGRYFWNKRTKDGFERAVECFEAAIAKDPGYGRAYAGLADTYGLMSTWGFVPQQEFMPKARQAALKAIVLDDTLAEAHTSLALVLENYDYDWTATEKEFRRAIDLDPSYATAHQWYAEYLSWQGRFDEALAESERARQLDPLSLIIATDHGAILYFARQYDRAIAQFRGVLDMDPTFDRARVLLAFVYVEKNEFPEARNALDYRSNPDDSPMTWAAKAYVYGRSGRHAEARQAMAKLESIVRHSQTDCTPPLLFAYLGLNAKDEAIVLLRNASLRHSNAVVGAKVAPYDDSLRDDPRFQQVLHQIRLDR